MIEEWKPVVGFEGMYLISNLGNIKTVAKIIMRRDGKPQHIHECNRKYALDNKGYYITGLNCNDILTTIKVHREIAKAFIPNPHNKAQVNHINGIKTDNRVENLEWCSNADNMYHAQVNNLVANLPKPVIQCTMSGTFVARYDSLLSAERAGFKVSAISAICNKTPSKGRSNPCVSHRGFRWKFENN